MLLAVLFYDINTSQHMLYSFFFTLISEEMKVISFPLALLITKLHMWLKVLFRIHFLNFLIHN